MRARGFTLLEMVVAIGIFAVIAAVSYASLNRFLATRTDLEAKNDALKQLQLAFAALERDIRYVAPRPVRDGGGETEAALVAYPPNPAAPGELLRLTVSGPENTSPALSRLTRVAWRVADGKLYRVVWKVLDRDAASEEYMQPVLAEVATVEMQFYRVDGAGALQASGEWVNPDRLPDGIEIQLALQNGRQYRRLFELVHAAP